MLALVGGEVAGALAAAEGRGWDAGDLRQPRLADPEVAGEVDEDADVQARLHRGDQLAGRGRATEVVQDALRAGGGRTEGIQVVFLS